MSVTRKIKDAAFHAGFWVFVSVFVLIGAVLAFVAWPLTVAGVVIYGTYLLVHGLTGRRRR